MKFWLLDECKVVLVGFDGIVLFYDLNGKLLFVLVDIMNFYE